MYLEFQILFDMLVELGYKWQKFSSKCLLAMAKEFKDKVVFL